MTLETTSRKHQRKVDLYCARRDDTMLDILFSGVIAWDCRLMNKMQKGVELLLRYKNGSGVSAYYSSLPCWTIPPSPEKDPRPSISHFSCTYALDTSNRYSLVPQNPLRLAQISFRPSRACYLSDGAVIMHTKPPNGNSTAHKMSATTPRSPPPPPPPWTTQNPPSRPPPPPSRPRHSRSRHPAAARRKRGHYGHH